MAWYTNMCHDPWLRAAGPHWRLKVITRRVKPSVSDLLSYHLHPAASWRGHTPWWVDLIFMTQSGTGLVYQILSEDVVSVSEQEKRWTLKRGGQVFLKWHTLVKKKKSHAEYGKILDLVDLPWTQVVMAPWLLSREIYLWRITILLE